jgi:uncharacterized protein YycO
VPGTEPNPGDIGCVSIPGDVGFLIRLGQACLGLGFRNVEHCFVYVGDGQIVEAEPGGARLADLAEYDARETVWVRCPEQHRETVAEAARALIGTPYGFADYAALALHRFHIPIPGLARYCNSDRSLICSQLAVVAARRGGWPLLMSKPAGYVVPADLAKLTEPPA